MDFVELSIIDKLAAELCCIIQYLPPRHFSFILFCAKYGVAMTVASSVKRFGSTRINTIQTCTVPLDVIGLSEVTSEYVVWIAHEDTENTDTS